MSVSDDEFAIDDETDVGVTGVASAGIRRADIAYVIDCTRSMDDTEKNGIPLLSGIKDCIGELVGFYQNEDVTVRLGLTEFRDQTHTSDERYGRHLLCHHEWEGSRFTSNLTAFKKTLDGLEAAGGGAQKESVYDALVTTAQWNEWADGASRIIVLFTDTRPHTRDLVVKSKQKAVEKLRKAGINQLHLCINEKEHRDEYHDFYNIAAEDSDKEITDIHDIMHRDMRAMTDFLKRVHKGSVYRLNAAITGSRYGRAGRKGSRIRRSPPKPKVVVKENRLDGSGQRHSRYGRS
jgi:hypothetical protein|tara:strand:+ start:1026 stop:1901 length:876 start_codon:yes stop_codon:yes gene_type:complete